MANIEEKRKSSKANKEKKGMGRKIKEVWSELKKVSWPTFPTVVKNTAIVLAVVAIFLVVLLVFDMALTYGVFNPLTSRDTFINIFGIKDTIINFFKAGIR